MSTLKPIILTCVLALLLLSVSSLIYKLLTPSTNMPFLPVWQAFGKDVPKPLHHMDPLVSITHPSKTHDHVRQKDSVTPARGGNFMLCLPPPKSFTSRTEGSAILAPVSLTLAPRAQKPLCTCSKCALTVSLVAVWLNKW